MPTFVYKLNAKITVSGFSEYNATHIDGRLQDHLHNVILSWFSSKCGSAAASNNTLRNTHNISANCTEEQSDELVSELSDNTYLCVHKVYSHLLYFVSFQKMGKNNFEYALHSSVPQRNISDGDADEEDEERDRLEFANNLISGCEADVSNVNALWCNGVVIVTASCTEAACRKIIAESLAKVSVNVEKIYGGEICFWPEHVRGAGKLNRVAAADRAAALFKAKAVEDPLIRDKHLTYWRAKDEECRSTFQLVPSQFLRRAKMMPPVNPQPTASGFSQWVYSLYSNDFGDEEDRERGKEMEQVIFKRRQSTASSANNSFLQNSGSDWRLIHNGLHLDGREQVDYFVVDRLRVNGEPLRISPDLVYRNNKASSIIIVEVKFSRLPITTNLWPNVWAQLWCYAQLQIARNASNVTVIGEVWGEKWTRSYGKGRNRVEGYPLLCLRASVRRDPRAPAYDKFFRSLFEIYCGK